MVAFVLTLPPSGGMTIEPVLDHVDTGLDRLLEQFKGKPKLAAILTSYLRQVQELDAAIYSLTTLTDADALEGKALELLGRVVGQPREGRDDPTLRLWIRARQRVNRSFGRPIDLIEVAQILVAGFPGVVVRFEEQYPAAVVVHAEGGPVLEYGEAIAKLLKQTKLGGVRVGFHWAVTERVFRFAPTSTVVTGSDYGFKVSGGIDGLDTWSLEHTDSDSQVYYGLAFTAAGVGLAVRNSGIVARSPADLDPWVEGSPLSGLTFNSPNLYGIAAGSGEDVVASGSTTDGGIDANVDSCYPFLAFTDDGGLTYTQANDALLNTALGYTDLRQIYENNSSSFGRNIAYGAGVWVRVCEPINAVFVSANGLDWSIYDLGISGYDYQRLTYVDGVGFVLILFDSGTAQASLMISADGGETWSPESLPLPSLPGIVGTTAYEAIAVDGDLVVGGGWQQVVIPDPPTYHSAIWRRPISGGTFALSTAGFGADEPVFIVSIAPISGSAFAVSVAGFSGQDLVGGSVDGLETFSALNATGIANPDNLPLFPLVFSGRGRLHALRQKDILSSAPISVSGASTGGGLSNISGG